MANMTDRLLETEDHDLGTWQINPTTNRLVIKCISRGMFIVCVENNRINRQEVLSVSYSYTMYLGFFWAESWCSY